MREREEWKRDGGKKMGGGRKEMREAERAKEEDDGGLSPLHATAVSLRQKAVCIIMGCHLISSGRGQGGGGAGPRRGGKGGRL